MIKKTMSSNFFKENITKKLKTLMSAENFDFTEHLKEIVLKLETGEKLNSSEFETIGNIAYFIGTDITSMQYISKQVIENMRKRFEEFPFTGTDIIYINMIFKLVKLNLFEDAKEEMKNLVNSEIVCSDKMALLNIVASVKNNMKKNEFPVKFAIDVQNICTKSKLCYNDLLKFNSLINQQYVVYGKNLKNLEKLYGDKTYNSVMEVALYYFDLQKYAAVYVDNILSVNEILTQFKDVDILSLLNDEIFNEYKFEFNTIEDVLNHIEQKEIEESIKQDVKEDIKNKVISEPDDELDESDFNFAQKPDLFLKAVFEEISETKIVSKEIFASIINAIIDNDEQLSNTYQYMAKYKNFEKRISFEEIYPELNKEEIVKYLEENIVIEKKNYEAIIEKLCGTIPADNINRIVTYVNNCIEELCISDAEDKGYLMTQLLENQITTWRHLQQIIGLIEKQNILGSGYQSYCDLANYLETKTEAKNIFDEGNLMEDIKIKLSYFIQLKTFLFPENEKKEVDKITE